MNLSAILGVCRGSRDERGRAFVSLPPPYDGLRLYTEETLTPAKAARLAEAIRFFQARSGATSTTDDDRALAILKNATVFGTKDE